ncbi:hypothetical protein EPN87_00900 [archaeon]|nr:MAG: hypothetical protein EPN87_00900 [archaeon]
MRFIKKPAREYDLTIQEELDLIDPNDDKTVLDEETGMYINKNSPHKNTYGKLRPPYESPFHELLAHLEVYTFSHPEMEEKIIIDNEPEISFQAPPGLTTTVYWPNDIKIMLEVSKLARKLLGKRKIGKYTLYKRELLLAYALENLPGNHPIFQKLESD